MTVLGTVDPVADARRHLGEIDVAVGLTGVDLESLASARPEWPVWPQPALSALVGPPSCVLANLDLRWLHRFEATVGALDAQVAAVGGPTGGPSGLSLLVERAAMLGHHGWGSWSAGTSCRMLRCADRWLAVNLPREDDLAAVPALLECDAEAPAWSLLETRLPQWRAAHVVERAVLLGLAVTPEPPPRAQVAQSAALVVEQGGRWRCAAGVPLVVDLSSLWAGPLTGSYVARAGADVRKVESSARPDGARLGTPAFYRRLNGQKRLIELDLATREGIDELRRLVAAADIVIEASRPRALAAWGLDAGEAIAQGVIWCRISGHGSIGEDAGPGRIAFGDDAAAAAGLVTYVDEEPWFIGDAAADPIAGVTAALGIATLWRRQRAGLVEVSMVDAVAALTGGVPVASQVATARAWRS